MNIVENLFSGFRSKVKMATMPRKKSVKRFCSVMSSSSPLYILFQQSPLMIVAPNQSCGSFIKKLDYDLWSHLVKILTIMHHLAISTRYSAVQTLSFVTLFSLLIHLYRHAKDEIFCVKNQA